MEGIASTVMIQPFKFFRHRENTLMAISPRVHSKHYISNGTTRCCITDGPLVKLTIHRLLVTITANCLVSGLLQNRQSQHQLHSCHDPAI